MPALTSTKLKDEILVKDQVSEQPGEESLGLSLSAEEVTSLLQGRKDSLVGITGKMAGAYSGQSISATDRKAAEQIFRLLVRETEIQVRKTLAEQIKRSTTIPRDIILTLAHDINEVALPILEYSQVLTDHDLLALIEATQEHERHVAIAKRPSVSEVVSGSLLDTGSEGVAAALVQNNGAHISEIKLTGIVATHGDNEALMTILRNRPGLPVSVAEKLVTAVAQNFGESLKETQPLPEKEFELEITKARESETLRLAQQFRSQEDINQLISQLIAFNRLTPSLILSALCQGDSLFFETALARLSGVPLPNARTLINDRGDLGFRAIYNKSGLPESLFQAVRLLLKVVQTLAGKKIPPSHPDYSGEVVALLLQHPLPVDNLSYMVALVRKSASL